MTQLHLKPHLDEVIQCLVEKQKSNTRFRKPPPENITNLYQSTKTLLSQFQGHINRCKKYNQAKIHRKYQILIKDLSDENDILKSKVTEQLHARPSSQKYVSDLIDKMIELRRQNERLMRENQSLYNIISTYQSKSSFLIHSNRDEHNPQNKELLKKEFEKNILKDTLACFLANKKTQNRNKQVKENSNFEKFLMFNKGKVEKWQMIDFFEKIDKWTANLKDMRFIDRSKIKSSFQHSYENEREESHLSVDRLPNIINTLRMTRPTKMFLDNSSISKGKLVERIIAKNKKMPSFRLRTLTHQQQERTIQEHNIR